MSEFSGDLPVLSSEPPAKRRFRVIPIALLLSAAVTLYVYAPLYGLRLGPRVLDDLRYLILDLRSGFLGLLIGLFVLFTAPFLLTRLSRRGAGGRRGRAHAGAAGSRRTSGAGRAAGSEKDAGSGTSSGPIFSSDTSEDQITVSSMSLREMGAGERWEMAEALGIPWRDELILDHGSWDAACREAIDLEAERIRR